jgi:hypothetical protein
VAVTSEQLERFRAARVAASARWRNGHKEQIRRRRRQLNHERLAAREWLFLDGEGWGVDELGRQCYRMMGVASASGFEDALLVPNGVDRLATAEILEWLCWLVPHYRRWCRATGRDYIKPNVAGFSLGYDYAHILLDCSLQQLEDVFHNQDHEAPWVEFVTDTPASYLLKLTAGHLQVKRQVAGKQLGYAGIWDVYRYFKGGFAQASAHLATAEEREIIEAGKARRGQAEHDPQAEMEYMLTECRVGSRLIKNLEEQGQSLELYPSSWYGPGSLAHLALRNQGVEESFKPDEEHDPALVEAARRAFVGGRFETTGHGRLPFLMEYDIKSAYPESIYNLPCLRHARWRRLEGRDLPHPGDGRSVLTRAQGLDVTSQAGSAELEVLPFWTLYRVRWDNHDEPLAGGWGPWPARVQPGRVSESDDGFDAQMLPVWPWSGETWVWGPEFTAGQKLLAHSPSATADVLEAWVPTVECSCSPFAWVADWYYRRQEMAYRGDQREWWLKLILNSLYGKFAQQVGRAVWHSWLWAGMITAHTRAKLLEAMAQDPAGVVMTATDAIYSVHGLNLEVGSALGQWEGQALGQAFVVQSGFFNSEAIYGDGHPRTRGLPARYIEWPRFEALWDDVLAGRTAWDQAKVVVDRDPATGKPFQIHVGIGLAQLWNKPEKMGAWLDYPTTLTFVTDKRPFAWKEAPERGLAWISTKPWYLLGNAGAEYRPGRGIGEDKFTIMDQPNAQEWGDI